MPTLLSAQPAIPSCAASALVELQEPEDKHSTPHVSPYRLAGHLASAFIIYGSLLWTTLTLALPTPTTISGSRQAAAGALALRRHALPLTALIGLTALSGDDQESYNLQTSAPGPLPMFVQAAGSARLLQPLHCNTCALLGSRDCSPWLAYPYVVLS